MKKKQAINSSYIPKPGVSAAVRARFAAIGAIGGKSRSLRKRDAARINALKAGRPPGVKNGEGRRARFLKGDQAVIEEVRGQNVPPMSAPVVACAGHGCTFTMLLSTTAVASLAGGTPVRWQCPRCKARNITRK